MNWLPWHTNAFARARAERKPVLLSIVTSWSHACAVMDATTYVDPAVVSLVADRFVPIRVDADRRPDISERYSLGGWPTTAFLTADGAVAGGGTFVAADQMPALLERASSAFSQDLTVTEGAPHRDPHGRPPAIAVPDDDLVDIAFAGFDDRYGGFGVAPKYPVAAPIRLALALDADAHPRARDIAVTTLDAMGWGPLYDGIDGGFFHYSERRDWSEPHVEKLLETQASMLALYAEAAGVLGVERYAERARDVVRYAQNWLADGVDGGWAASQRADPAFFRSVDRNDTRARPAIDRTILARANGAMISAALKAARLLEDESLGHAAIAALERVLLLCYRPGQGVAHVHDGTAHVRGLTADQFAMAGAALDAYEANGNIVYEMMAEELARHALRIAWDDDRGGFFDRALPDEEEAIGAMTTRMRSFAENCEAAEVLARLAATSGEHDFTGFARATLASIAAESAAQGPDTARLVLARRAVGLR